MVLPEGSPKSKDLNLKTGKSCMKSLLCEKWLQEERVLPLPEAETGCYYTEKHHMSQERTSSSATETESVSKEHERKEGMNDREASSPDWATKRVRKINRCKRAHFALLLGQTYHTSRA